MQDESNPRRRQPWSSFARKIILGKINWYNPSISWLKPGLPLKDKREYYLKNKETIREKSQKHYTENKDKILKKVLCECGLEVAQKSKVRHFKSKRHLLYLQTKK